MQMRLEDPLPGDCLHKHIVRDFVVIWLPVIHVTMN